MSVEIYEPAAKIQFKHNDGYRSGELVAVPKPGILRVRDTLSGIYYDVPANDGDAFAHVIVGSRKDDGTVKRIPASDQYAVGSLYMEPSLAQQITAQQITACCLQCGRGNNAGGAKYCGNGGDKDNNHRYVPIKPAPHSLSHIWLNKHVTWTSPMTLCRPMRVMAVYESATEGVVLLVDDHLCHKYVKASKVGIVNI